MHHFLELLCQTLLNSCGLWKLRSSSKRCTGGVIHRFRCAWIKMNSHRMKLSILSGHHVSCAFCVGNIAPLATFFLKSSLSIKNIEEHEIVLHTWRAKLPWKGCDPSMCSKNLVVNSSIFSRPLTPPGRRKKRRCVPAKAGTPTTWWSEPDLNGFISWGQNINPGEPGKKWKITFLLLGTFIHLHYPWENTVWAEFPNYLHVFLLEKMELRITNFSLVFTCGTCDLPIPGRIEDESFCFCQCQGCVASPHWLGHQRIIRQNGPSEYEAINSFAEEHHKQCHDFL